jgi:hypothetical protein
MDTDVIHDHDWQMLVGLLPEDIEEIASRTGAILRRREIRSAIDLVRLALVYAQDDASLRGASAWAREAGVAQLSDQAILKRLRGSVGLLRELCSRLLASQGPTRKLGGHRLVLVDSTTVCRRRSKGTDFRVHVNYAASGCQISGVELTRADGGESLDRLPCGPGDVLVADQGYPSRLRLAHVRTRGAHFAVRIYPANVPLQDSSGKRVDPVELCRDLEIGQILDVPLATIATHDAPSVPGRLVAIRKTDEAVRRQLDRSRRNSGKPPSPQAEQAAQFMMVFTSLDTELADAGMILEIYRLRWQVEMAFKRAKGVVSLGETAAKDMELCEAKILAKLLLLLMIQAFETAFFPWGYPLPRRKSLAAA